MTELDPEARKLLSLARAARTPSAADKRRVQRRLALSAGLSVAAASGAAVAHAAEGASAASTAGGLFASLKLYVAGGALLLSAAGGYALLSPATPSSPPPRAAGPAAPVAPAPLDSPVLAPPSVSLEPAAPAPPLRAATQRAPRGTTLAKELDLLHSAQAAWRARNAAETLSLLDQHARRYPRSELRLERSALRVLALCEQGRTTEARRLGRALIRRAPNSPMRMTIEESCAIP